MSYYAKPGPKSVKNKLNDPSRKDMAAIIGRRIRQLRKKAGYTSIAKASQASHGAIPEITWSHYELGTEPGLGRALVICAVLKCSLADLLPDSIRKYYEEGPVVIHTEEQRKVFDFMTGSKNKK